MRRSITARLVIMFALAAFATFALIGAALYVVLERELMRYQDDQLRAQVQNMQYSIERVGTTERWARVQAKMDTLTPANGSVRFWVLSDDPRFQYGKGLGEIAQMRRSGVDTGSIDIPGRRWPLRTLSRDIAPLQDRPAVRLVVGIDSAPFAHTLRNYLSALALLLLGAVLLVMLSGTWIARVGLRPLVRLSREARALQPKTLSQRLSLTDLPVELFDLTTAFNGALDRLEATYQRLEAFNADVAHELRTPLANIIGGTQVALSRPRSAAQFQETLQSNLEEMERLRSIINDMLFLARADQGEAATSLIQASVADEVRKTIDFFEVVLDEMQASVSIEGDVGAQATLETALFRRAMSNLLQNAIEHSSPGARLTVHIVEGPAAIWVEVSNPGAPVATGHLQRLFDRFYRADAARHGSDGHHGHGLGLAIVKAVATMHGGGVGARSEAGVTTIGFSVPRAIAEATT
ncbi:MAG TPA: heavy metal sensor histidine kinase [Caldimonas sp.]|jgi:two-component system heavy metal sensor histidine kinase CusS|nr:heavy metal sensor histidine kinase [Caldimonas sp.]HEX4233039.1 heavy metal sensor histidine kinase [Caldimonas sp.]